MLFWRTGMATLIAAAVLAAVRLTLDTGELAARMEFLLGILMIGGVFTALINGMLYKIVPFIVWLHLQRVLAVPPNMHQMIPERMMAVAAEIFSLADRFEGPIRSVTCQIVSNGAGDRNGSL